MSGRRDEPPLAVHLLRAEMACRLQLRTVCPSAVLVPFARRVFQRTSLFGEVGAQLVVRMDLVLPLTMRELSEPVDEREIPGRGHMSREVRGSRQPHVGYAAVDQSGKLTFVRPHDEESHACYAVGVQCLHALRPGRVRIYEIVRQLQLHRSLLPGIDGNARIRISRLSPYLKAEPLLTGCKTLDIRSKIPPPRKIEHRPPLRRQQAEPGRIFCA